ncbi:helix-turn-helix domain-containing protein [Streptomyces sp. M19]
MRQAALELFAERGFEATSTRAVAAAAGLSPALVTRHFGSKQGCGPRWTSTCWAGSARPWRTSAPATAI